MSPKNVGQCCIPDFSTNSSKDMPNSFFLFFKYSISILGNLLGNSITKNFQKWNKIFKKCLTFPNMEIII